MKIAEAGYITKVYAVKLDHLFHAEKPTEHSITSRCGDGKEEMALSS